MLRINRVRFDKACAWLAPWIGLAAPLAAQTSPSPQPLPYSQNFGTTTFTSMPIGTSAWSGLSGASVSSSTSAAGSIPSANASVTATTTTETTGGSYGLASAGNARFYIQTSSNTTNGANQLAVAVNTIGRTAIVLGYDVEIVSAQPRTVGVLCQYRVGGSGAWTTVSPASGTNPVSQAGGATGLKTTVQATLPAAAENQSNLQIRWATWRGTETGSSSGAAIDNITITGTAAGSSLTVTATPDTFSEAAGQNATLVTVTSATPAATDLAVTLASSNTGKAVVESPNPAIIPAGSSSVTFHVSAVDDAVFQGNQTVALQASAAGTGTASINVTVLDDEDAYTPPANYYAGAAGLTGSALKSALHTIIANGHVQYSYSNTYAPLKAIYADPDDPERVLTVYSGTSVPKNDTYRPVAGSDPDVTWSREHAWPASFGLDSTNVDPGSSDGDAGPDYTDLFNLRPALQTVNNLRSNKYYDESTGTVTVPPLAPGCSSDGDSFKPRDVEKGDLARAMFYMATRYDGSEPLTLDLEINETPSAAAGRFAKLSTLLKWSEEDPVSPEERRRNQTVSSYQHNRNPFVDHPEYLALIWGSLRIDSSSLAVTEGGPPASYQLRLTSQPTADVVVDITGAPTGQVTVSPSNVTFTTANWNQPVSIAVSAIDDTAYETIGSVTLQHAITTSDPYYSTLSPTTLPVTVTDNDPLIAPASLPLAYGGPWSPLPSVGFMGNSIGTYSTSLGGDSGDGSAQFNATDDKLTISYNGSAAALAYNIKGNPASGQATEGTFLILESPDGITYTTLRTITNKSNADQAFADRPLPSSRFIAFLYSGKVSGNIQLDKLAITPTPSSAWLALYGLTGFGGDHDSDGLPDLAEYALGASPVVSDLSTVAPVVTKPTGKLQLTAVIRINDPSLLSTVETTSDLSSPGSWTESGVTKVSGVSQTGVPSGFERMTFEVTDSGNSTRFLRIRFFLN